MWQAVAILDKKSALPAAPVESKAETAAPSVAVLPFTDMSGDTNDDRFADAIHDQIINILANNSALNPVARTSMLAFKDTRLNARQIADSLRVRYVVEGSVQRRGNRVKIVTQLIDPQSNNRHVSASDSVFDSRIDRFTLEDQVASWVVARMLSALGFPAEHTALPRTTTSAAYDAYLRGKALANERTREGLTKTINQLEESVKLDPSFGPANTALAFAYGLWGTYGYDGPNSSYEAYARAISLAERGVHADPANGDAHAIYAYLLTKAFAPAPQIDREFRAAVRLLPSSSDVHALYAAFLGRQGKYRDAIAEARRAVVLDPVSPGRLAGLGWYALAGGDLVTAIDAARRANVLEPELSSPHVITALADIMLQRAAACPTVELGKYVAVRALCMHAAGQPAAAAKIVAAFEASNPTGPPAAHLATYYAFTGDYKRAAASLQKSFNDTPFGLDFRVVDSELFAAARRDRAFAAAWTGVRRSVWRRIEQIRPHALP